MGYFCINGAAGIVKNKDEGILWYKKAAVQGDADAQSALKKMGLTW